MPTAADRDDTEAMPSRPRNAKPKKAAGRRPEVPAPDPSKVLAAKRRIINRRERVGAPGVERLPVDARRADPLELAEHVVDNPYRDVDDYPYWAADVCDALVGLQDVVARAVLLQARLLAAGRKAGLTPATLAGPMGLASRQGVRAREKHSAEILERYEQAAHDDQVPDGFDRRKRDWLAEHGEQLVEAARTLLDHRAGYTVNDYGNLFFTEVASDLADCDAAGGDVDLDFLKEFATDVRALAEDLGQRSGSHEPDARAALAAVLTVVSQYRDAVDE